MVIKHGFCYKEKVLIVIPATNRYELHHGDCISYMEKMPENSVDFTLTDIPYGVVSRADNGLRNLDKEDADVITFNLQHFLKLVLGVTRNSICVFCGKEQFSEIYGFFEGQPGTVRPIIWNKTNPSPMNGQYIYLSGVEVAVWFKKRGAKTFNAHCKNSVFSFPAGRSKLHPTEKNHALLKDLIMDNTNEGDTVFDPCAGSGSHLLVSLQNGRNAIGCEIQQRYYGIAKERLNDFACE